MKLFIPMLAATCKDLDKLQYPVLASIKLDGVRATVQGGRLLSRTLKPIPNRKVQELFSLLPEGLDGELILGDPTAPDCYRNTVSIVMSGDKSAWGITFHVFDRRMAKPFAARYLHIRQVCEGYIHEIPVTAHAHRMMNSRADLDVFEAAAVSAGHEGVMLRKPDGPYKEGLSTEREGYLLKVKRFADSEAVVLGVTELMHNGNEAKTNALGRTERSSHKDGKVGTVTLGALCVQDIKTGVEFEIGTGFTAAERVQLWRDAWEYPRKGDGLNGKLAKYKYFATGSKDKPRFPVFIGWRDRRDV